jgi:hypothetical protein
VSGGYHSSIINVSHRYRSESGYGKLFLVFAFPASPSLRLLLSIGAGADDRSPATVACMIVLQSFTASTVSFSCSAKVWTCLLIVEYWTLVEKELPRPWCWSSGIIKGDFRLFIEFLKIRSKFSNGHRNSIQWLSVEVFARYKTKSSRERTL